jgi:ankyrin repeat protein
MEEELEEAIRAGDLQTVKLLVQGGASIAKTNTHRSALHVAARYGKASIVEWLLNIGGASISDVDCEGFTALLCTTKRLHYDNIVTVQWLLEYGGVDITDTTPNGKTVWGLLPLPGFAERGNAATDRLTAQICSS